MHRVVIADDQVLIRVGISGVLEILGGYEVVGEASDGREAIELIARTNPDIALIDIDMPGMNGIEAVARLKVDRPSLLLVFVSAMDQSDIVMQAVRSGADGYILKDFVLDELALGLDTLLQGQRYLSPRIAQIVLNELAAPSKLPRTLTRRQTQILRMIAEGLTGKSIAQQLDISPKTVEFHRAEIMNRLNVRDIAGLTRYAIEMGLLINR